MLYSLKFAALPLAVLALLAESRLEDHRHLLHRTLNQARHQIRARVQQANLLTRDLSLALQGLSVSPQADSAHLIKRSSTRTCRINSSSVNAAGGNVTSPQGSGGSSARGTATSSKPHAPSPTSTSAFNLVFSYSGNDFFNKWDFNTGSDPTHGVVDYLTGDEAKAAGLAFVKGNGNFVMQVDTTPVVSNLRKSIRITNQQSFNGGLLIMDSVHMPTGCGTWPAWWTNGPDWPNNGEIDIIEGVNDYIDNQATVHTRDGCSMPSSFNNPSTFSQSATGQLVGGTNCAAPETNNQGCGVRFTSATASFGPGFNSNGGGVYAMYWNADGIAVYFFGRNNIPDDISSGTPDPTGWGLPAAMWPSASCDPFSFFQDHVAIFDTTLCGDWAGSAWTGSGIPGQDSSCAARTGSTTCEDFVLNNGASFQDAYWEVSYVKLYQMPS